MVVSSGSIEGNSSRYSNSDGNNNVHIQQLLRKWQYDIESSSERRRTKENKLPLVSLVLVEDRTSNTV